MENFSYSIYLKLLEKDDNSIADEYKNRFIPKYLYKYASFDKNTLYKEKMEQLEKEQIWASKIKILNDPFEFKVLFSILEDKDKETYDEIINQNEVISLTNTCVDKLMWSHYAEKHTGYCLEYKVCDEIRIYPVVYRNKRINITRDVQEWFKNISEWRDNDFNMSHGENEKYRLPSERFAKLFYYKDAVWKYENEYRIVTNAGNDGTKSIGSVHSCDEFNIKLSRVILGLNCSPEHQERIEKCVEKINKARYEKYIKGFDVSEYDKLRYLFNFNNENVKIAKIESDDNLHLIANDYICKY